MEIHAHTTTEKQERTKQKIKQINRTQPFKLNKYIPFSQKLK